MKVQIILWVYILLSSLPGLAQKLLIKSPHTPPAQFKAYLMTRPQFISLSDFQKKHLVSKKEAQSLIYSFTQAQKSYFSEPRLKSLNKFKQVIELKHLTDWLPSQRNQILHSFMRAYELSEDSKEKNELLIQAAQFSMGLPLNEKVFSPPTVNAYQKQLKETQQELWRPGPRFLDFHKWIINGKEFLHYPGITLSLPAGKVRVTALSYSHQVISQLIDSSELHNWSPKIKTLTSGNCQKNSIHKSYAQKELMVYFSEQCLVSFPKKTPHPALASFKPKINLTPHKKLLTSLPQKASESSARLNWKWVSLGAAILATGWLLSQKKESSPTHKTGF